MDETKAKGAVERTFSPEFRNRLDAWLLFHGLARGVILQVVDKELGQLRGLLEEKQVSLTISDKAREWLGEHGYDAAMGARPMARLIESSIKLPLSEALLFGVLKEGGQAEVDVTPDGKRLDLAYTPASAAT